MAEMDAIGRFDDDKQIGTLTRCRAMDRRGDSASTNQPTRLLPGFLPSFPIRPRSIATQLRSDLLNHGET